MRPKAAIGATPINSHAGPSWDPAPFWMFPDFVLILPWNLKDEIIAQNQHVLMLMGMVLMTAQEWIVLLLVRKSLKGNRVTVRVPAV